MALLHQADFGSFEWTSTSFSPGQKLSNRQDESDIRIISIHFFLVTFASLMLCCIPFFLLYYGIDGMCSKWPGGLPACLVGDIGKFRANATGSFPPVQTQYSSTPEQIRLHLKEARLGLKLLTLKFPRWSRGVQSRKTLKECVLCFSHTKKHPAINHQYSIIFPFMESSRIPNIPNIPNIPKYLDGKTHLPLGVSLEPWDVIPKSWGSSSITNKAGLFSAVGPWRPDHVHGTSI